MHPIPVFELAGMTILRLILIDVCSMTLARREMSIILATLFLKYDVYDGQPGQGPTLELYDTQRARDIDANSDYIIPVPAKGSQGLRVKIRNSS
jgi:hypothetical protein